MPSYTISFVFIYRDTNSRAKRSETYFSTSLLISLPQPRHLVD